MSKHTHTRTPWSISLGGEAMPENERLILADLGDRSIRTIGRTFDNAGPEESVANADFIVKACNLHEEMLAMLEKMDYYLGEIRTDFEFYLEVHNLIAKAKGAL